MKEMSIKAGLVSVAFFTVTFLFALFLFQENLKEEIQKVSYQIKNNTAKKDFEINEEELSFTECVYKIGGVPSPKGASFTPNGKEFWVTSLMNKNSGVVVFDTLTGEREKDIVLPGGGGVEIIFNSSGSFAFVSQMETGRVFKINTETKEIEDILPTNSTWTKVLALSPEEDTLYASNWSGNSVSVIDLESSSVKEVIPTVRTPRGIYVTEDGVSLYVAGFANGEIEKINLLTKERKILYRSGGAMRDIVGDEEKNILYISDMGKDVIYKVDTKTDVVDKLAKTENNPNTIRLSEDKKILIVSNRGINHSSGNYSIPGPEWGTVLFFNSTNGELVDVIVGGNQPTALSVTNSGDYFLYSNFLDGSIEVCKMADSNYLLKRDKGDLLNYEVKK